MDNMISGIENMGENLRGKFQFEGDEVRLYPLCKIIRAEVAQLDNNCQVFDYVYIDAGKGFKLGKYSTLTWGVLVEGQAQTSIGDRVFVGPGTKILNGTYEINGFYTVEHLPDGLQETWRENIDIDDDAYIGANSVVLPGVHIGEGAVVGANSMVNKDLEPWGIYAGTPCRKIGERQKPNKEKQELLQQVNWENHL